MKYKSRQQQKAVMARINEIHRTDRAYKTVCYSSKDLKPLGDSLAIYKGTLYGTKEDLKYFPKKVRLVKLNSPMKIKVRSRK